MNRTPMSQSYVNSQAGSSGSNVAGSQQPQQQTNQGVTFASSSSSSSSSSTGATNMNASTSTNLNHNQSTSNQQQQQQSTTTNTTTTTTTTAAAASTTTTTISNNQPNNTSATTFQQNVPPELTNLLLEFAFSVFVNKPINIVEYAANYFHGLNMQRYSTGNNGGQMALNSSSANVTGQQHNQFQQDNNSLRHSSYDSQRSHTTNNSTNQNDNDNSDDCMIYDDDYHQNHDQQQQQQQNNIGVGGQSVAQQPKLSFNRRKSVFAEQYDPAADDEDDENNRVVHSKTDEQRTRLAKAIKSIFIFRSVDPQDMTDILDAMFEVKVSSGDIVIRQGDDGDNFYVVERGKFQILVTLDDGTRQIRGECENSGSFGELALMYNQPRAATVLAITDGSLWAMDRNTFRKIVLKRAFKKRKEYEALFEKVSVLQCLNGYERMNLCDALESKRFDDGQQIIRQGDQANGMYFIESGRVKIVKKMDDGRTVDVAILSKGDYFGELALINHKPRAASACAVGEDAKVAFLDVKAFERLLGPCIDKMEKNCAVYLNELAQREGRENV